MNTATCVICLEEVDVRDTKKSLLSPCCNIVWIHRLCLEGSQTDENDGFKCSACACKREFTCIVKAEKCQSVESEENEPLKVEMKCDAEECLCDEGRFHNLAGSDWEILICSVCQIQGTHKQCSNLPPISIQWQCDKCEEISVKIEVEVDFPFGSAIETSVTLQPHRDEESGGNTASKERFECCARKCLYAEGRTANHAGTEWEIILCNICFSLGTHRKCVNLPTATMQWQCKNCRKLSGKLRRKIRDIVGPISEFSLKKHKRKSSRGKAREMIQAQAGADFDPKPYKCDFADCKAEFIQLSLLKRHQRVHTGEKPFKCDYADCKAEFTQLSTLQRHHRVHTGEKPYKCEYINCDAAFSNSDGFKRHQLTHTGEKPYKCVYFNCDAAFSYRTVFKRHQLIHTGEKPYKCDFDGCDSVFARSSTLTQHKRKHTGEKPYKCNYEGCTASYKHTFDLKTHRRKHTGERPFTCEFCNASFNCRKALKLHYRVHSDERPFKCVFAGCDSAYKKPDTLKKHREKHMAENPYHYNYNNFQAVIAGMTSFKTHVDDVYDSLHNHHPPEDVS